MDLWKMTKMKNKGVSKGFRHIWDYDGKWDETKKRPGLWKFNFKATKKKKSNSMGNFGVGTKGAWKINGIQYIKKTGKGRYKTNLVGEKRPLKFYVKKPKRYKRSKYNKYKRK